MSETLSMTTSNKGIGESIKDIEPEEPSLIDWKEIWKPLTWIVGGFLLFFFLPVLTEDDEVFLESELSDFFEELLLLMIKN